jgi:hypothetical protein
MELIIQKIAATISQRFEEELKKKTFYRGKRYI